MGPLSGPVRVALFGFGFFVLLFLLIFVFLFTTKREKPADILVAGPVSLTKPQVVLSPASFGNNESLAYNFLKGPAGTAQFFVYFDTLNRTGAAVKCGEQPNQPSCSTGLYRSCPCESKASCAECNHEGYLPLANLYGVIRIEVLNVPDASRPNAVAVQLAVKTESAAKASIETMPLPPIPVQKWVMITLARDGRRFDVFYDRNLVSSKMTDEAVSQIGTNEMLKLGDSFLSGAAAGFRMIPRRLDVQQVSNDYSASTDTRGNPNMIEMDADAIGSVSLNTQNQNIKNAFCLDGSCLRLPSIPGPTVTMRTFGDLAQTYVGPGGQIVEYGPVSPVYQVESNYL